jgi:hypothetical protein
MGLVGLVALAMGKEKALFFGRDDVDIQEEKKEREVQEEWIECTQQEGKPEEWEEVQNVKWVACDGEGEFSDQLLGVLFEHRVCMVFGKKLDHPHLAAEERHHAE